jgi:phage-related protein
VARGTGTVIVSIIGKADKLKSTLDQSGKDLDGFGDKMAGFGKSAMVTGAKFTAGLTLPIVGGLGLATKAAVEDAEAQSKLAKTLQNTVGASAAVVKSVEDQISGFMKVSTFADDELRPAFENLVRSTKDVDEANKMMGLAMDIAAAKGLPLSQVSMALAKAHDGNVGALGRLGIATKDNEGKTKSFEQVMKDASETFGGSAANALDTSAGKSKALTRDLGELTEQIGTALIPILDKIIPIISKVAEWFSGLSPTMQTVVLVVAGLAAAIGPLITVVGALSVALGFLAANPVVLIVAGVAALVAGIILAYQKVEWFRNFVNGAFDVIKAAFEKTPVGWLIANFETIVNTIRGLPARIKSAASGMWDGIKDAFRGALNWIIDAWNAIEFKIPGIDPPGPGPKWGGITLGVPDIPRLAAGGIVTRPTLGLVGEAGPEAIVPLGRGGGGFGTSIVVNVSGALDPTAVAQQIQQILADEQRRGGNLGLS